MMEKNLERLFLQIRTDKFYFLKFILEAYDGMAILSSSGISSSCIESREIISENFFWVLSFNVESLVVSIVISFSCCSTEDVSVVSANPWEKHQNMMKMHTKLINLL